MILGHEPQERSDRVYLTIYMYYASKPLYSIVSEGVCNVLPF